MKDKDKSLEYNTPWDGLIRVVPKIDLYAENNNLYVGLDFYDKDSESWLPYTDITVNVGRTPYLESAIDTNNNGNAIISFLEKNGFGHLTGLSIESGYCAFPVFKFNEDKLKEVDRENFALYAKAHGRDVRSLDDTIKTAKEQGIAEIATDKDKIKEPFIDEAR